MSWDDEMIKKIKEKRYVIIGGLVGLVIGILPYFSEECEFLICKYAHLPLAIFVPLARIFKMSDVGAAIFLFFSGLIFYPIFGALLGYYLGKYKERLKSK